MEDPNLAYVLLKPDVVIRDIVLETVRYFEDQPYDLLKYRCVALSEKLFSLMYTPSFRWDLDHWSINRQAYNFGPVIGLLLWRKAKTSTGLTAQEELAARKGSALPEWLTPESIRSRLGASSRVFNILHIPETPQQALLEAGCFFSSPSLLNQGVPITQRPSDASYSKHISQEIAAHGYYTERALNGFATYTFLKIRWLHSLEFEAQPGTAEIQDLTRQLRRHYASISKRLLDERDFGTRRHLLMQSFEGEEPMLRRLGELIPDRLMVNVILNLNGNKQPIESTFDFFWHLLSENHVYVSDLEKYLVCTVFIYPTKSNT